MVYFGVFHTVEKKKYRSIYFKEEILWEIIEAMAKKEQRSVNAMAEILIKKALGPNMILKGIEKHGAKTHETK
jgi:hypothetical protein